MAPPMDPASLQNLRSLVHDCLAKHLYDSAIFFADKLACFTNNAPIEVYNLANAFFVARQYRRCLHLLRTSGLVEKDVRFRYLAARCLAEIKEYEECLEMLGGIDVRRPEELIEALAVPPSTPGVSLDYLSAIFLLRGQVYDALENFPRAVQWYKAALARDPFCHGAFAALIERHRIKAQEEADLAEELQAAIPEDQRWLGYLYRARCNAYGGTRSTADAVALLEGDEKDPPGGPYGWTPPPPWGSTPGQQSTPSTGDAAMSGATPPPSTRAATRRASSASAMAISPISEGSQEGTTGGKDRSTTPAGGGGGGTGRSTRRPSSAGTPGAILEERDNMPRRIAPDPEFNLLKCAEVVAAGAELAVQTGMFSPAFATTARVLERDPFAESVLPAHLAAAVAVGSKHELFSLGHRLMKASPDKASSWYAAGCYYYATKQYASARHYFAKATSLDKGYAPAWIGFAQSFAAQDETDQAMAAFRTAARLFPGLHVPLLGMGLEYARMNNGALAEQTLLRANRRCPGDPAVAHELGTLLYRQGRFEEALDWLSRALAAAPRQHPSLWEPTVVNLGHTLRKLKRYDESVDMFSRALAANPKAAGTHAALGFVHQLRGEAGKAVECYHAALGLDPGDDLVAGLLAAAVAEETEAMTADLTRSMQIS